MPGALGVIVGTSDALVGLAKLAGGPLANDPCRRARLASGGYLGTALATAAIGLASAVWQVAVLRAVATTLLILRATDLLNTGSRDLAAATSLAILLYAGHNAAATLAAPGGGHLVDRFGALAVFGLVQSLGDLGPSAVVGLLWSLVSPQLAFGYAAAWMLCSVVAIRWTARTSRASAGRSGTRGT